MVWYLERIEEDTCKCKDFSINRSLTNYELYHETSEKRVGTKMELKIR